MSTNRCCFWSGWLLAGILSGCAATGRFTPEQYSRLDDDPFLSGSSAVQDEKSTVAESSQHHSDDPSHDAHESHEHQNSAPVLTAVSPERPAAPDASAARDDSCCRSESDEFSFPEETAPQEAITDLFSENHSEHPESSPIRQTAGEQSTAETDDAFDAFLRSQNRKVVQADATIPSDSRRPAHPSPNDSDEDNPFFRFPGEQPSSESVPNSSSAGRQTESASLSADNDFPFDEDESLHGDAPQVAPPDDVFGSDAEDADDAGWPPGNFEFN